MKLKELVAVGERIEIGTYEFTAERIIAFAEKFDPQYFHLDAEKAKHSVLGGLCASGWHVSAAMMKCNVATIERQARDVLARGGTPPTFGPSPGFKNLKWLKPAYAGDTVTYAMRFTGDRPFPNRPGWNIAEITYEGVNQRGELVFTADCSVVEFD
ncbi:MAG: MaoC family dehydratase [Rhizobium sp.]|nr:MaoC family dehydratase [Rhizobium sp.]